jgi:RNA polymerase sigma-70 factor (ECF subfamily)
VSALFRATRAADFDRLYRHHGPAVYRYAFAVLGNSADAEDVTQQTFLNAYRAIVQGTKPRKAENWLLTIAHNEVRRHFRTNGKAVEVELDDRLAHPAPERSDPSLADVLRALQHLPPMQRSALVMREFEGRTYAEIAEVLNVTQSALETLIFRARRGLAEQLEGDLSCSDAEQALSRRLDGRLARREGRRLKAHLHDCARCVRFAAIQKRQRGLLKGLSVMPIPASLFLFRGEHAAAAGVGGSAAAAAGSTAVGATGVATGIAAKAAAVAATAAVAGGAGYGVATRIETLPKADAKAVHAAAVPERPLARQAEKRRIGVSIRRLRVGSAAPVAIAPARRKAIKPRANAALPAARRSTERPAVGRERVRVRAKPAMPAASRRAARPTAKPEDRQAATRPRPGKRLGTVKRADPKPIRPAQASEKPKPPPVVPPLPAPPLTTLPAPALTVVKPAPKK